MFRLYVSLELRRICVHCTLCEGQGIQKQLIGFYTTKDQVELLARKFTALVLNARFISFQDKKNWKYPRSLN